MNSKKTFVNLIWRFAERCGAQGVSFLVSIVLARLLAPEAYGTVALVTVFTTILQVFVDSGLGNALIQKKDADELDFSTVFYFNVGMCLVLYIIMFSAAPYIASFYNDESLTSVIRVLCLTLVISGVKNVQQAYVSRNLLFKKFFFATLGGTIGAAILGIVMAYRGFGIWALVAQQVLNAVVDTIILWITVKWHPKRMFSLERLKMLFSFGWKLLVSALLDTVYNNIRQLIIGVMYSSADLAYYNRGKQFPNLMVGNINSSIDSVLLPVLSSEQDHKERVKQMTQKAIRTSSYIMWPLMVGLMVTAKPIVSIVLTDKWLDCVPYLRIFCFTYAFWPIHTANLNAIKAMGRSDYFLKLEIVKKAVGLMVLFSTMWFGVMVMAYSLLVTAVLSSFINAYPNKKLLGYSYWDQIKDILPSVLLAFTMGLLIMPVGLLELGAGLTLVMQVLLGAFVYIVGSAIFRLESYRYVLEIVIKFIKKKNE